MEARRSAVASLTTLAGLVLPCLEPAAEEVVELAVPVEMAAGRVDQQEYWIADSPVAEGTEEGMPGEGTVVEGEEEHSERHAGQGKLAAGDVSAPSPFVG